MKPFIGEIRAFAGNYAPEGWMLCDGKEVPVADYQALYSLIGNSYGGDHQAFKLPDLRGRLALGYGTGTGLTPRNMSAQGGAESVVLSEAELPTHSHTFNISSHDATANAPDPSMMLGTLKTNNGPALGYLPESKVAPVTIITHLNPNSIGNTGRGLAHNNMQPCLSINYIIAINGEYPNVD